MKPFVTLATLLLLSVTAISQKDKDIPEFGKIEKSELEMKDCDFDKNAEALVLFDAGVFDASGLSMPEMYIHVRIKILKDKGLNQADIKIPFISYKGFQSVRHISAQTYNLDPSGNITVSKVEKKLIYEKKLNKRVTEMVFTFPEVKVGSVIEYKYMVTNAGLNNWYFQRPIPVIFSRYKIVMPYEIEINTQPFVSLQLDSKKETKGNNVLYYFSMRNIPALRNEPYISCDDDYLQRLESRLIAFNGPNGRRSLIRSWPGIVKELMEDEDFGLQLKKEIPRTADLDAELKGITDPYQKMVTIHRYVQKNMEWNGYTDIWAYDGVKAAWKDKKGTIGEINLILVNLLKDAGLDVRPLLVSTRENGRINTLVAGFEQFDKVMAYVIIGEKIYVLDASDKYTSPNLIPFDVMYTNGLVIGKVKTIGDGSDTKVLISDDWGWRDLWDERPLKKRQIALNTQITEQGLMKGEAFVSCYDYARIERMPDLKKGKDKFKEEYFNINNSNITIDSLNIENEDNDTLPLVQRIHFSQQLSASGEYQYFTINMFTGLEKNPFVADSRFSDVFFGANQQLSIACNVRIPQNFVFEELPKSVRMIMPDTSISITRRCIAENNQLSVRVFMEFKKPFFTTEEYPDFQEFYKKLFDMLNEQFVIRQKAIPKP